MIRAKDFFANLEMLTVCDSDVKVCVYVCLSESMCLCVCVCVGGGDKLRFYHSMFQHDSNTLR